MMNKQLSAFKKWYEFRPRREKFLVAFLMWAIIYFFIYYIFLRPLDEKKLQLNNEIKLLTNQTKTWELQIDALKKIGSSPLYKKWQAQSDTFRNLHGKYKNLLRSPSSTQLQDAIKTVLQSQNNVTIVQIKNTPETLLNNTQPSTLKIYEQRVQVIVFSNYFDTINYIKRLEELLPNVYWGDLNYQVIQYPTANIEMEFAIFYEKPA